MDSGAGEGGGRLQRRCMWPPSPLVGDVRVQAAQCRLSPITFSENILKLQHTTLAGVGRQVLSGHASEGMGLGKEVVHSAKRKEKPAYKIFIIVVFIVAKPEYDPRD